MSRAHKLHSQYSVRLNASLVNIFRCLRVHAQVRTLLESRHLGLVKTPLFGLSSVSSPVWPETHKRENSRKDPNRFHLNATRNMYQLSIWTLCIVHAFHWCLYADCFDCAHTQSAFKWMISSFCGWISPEILAEWVLYGISAERTRRIWPSANSWGSIRSRPQHCCLCARLWCYDAMATLYC